MSFYNLYKKERLEQLEKMYTDSYKHNISMIKLLRTDYIPGIFAGILGGATFTSGLIIDNDFFILTGLAVSYAGYITIKDTREILDSFKKYKDSLEKRLLELGVNPQNILTNTKK